MGLLNKIKEIFGVNRAKFIDDPTDSRDNFLRDLITSRTSDILTKIHTFSDKRDGEIDEYKQMLKDGVTLAAVNLLTDDATQLDQQHGAVAWITCQDDPDFADSMNKFLIEKFNINDVIYSIAYNVIAFGECFVRTHYDDKDGYLKHFKLGEYFMIDDISDVNHIYKYGVPLGYIRKSSDKKYYAEILPEKSYIHFINDRGSKEYLEEYSDEVYISYGTSMLEGAKYYYKQRQLLDDLLILSRLTRSSKYNLFKVEVGQATSQDTARMIREVKTAVQQQQEVNVSSQVFSSRNAPLLSGGNIYFPVRDGKGGVDVQQITDDPNVSALKDLDYFNQNYYSALGVPQAFLGNTTELPGGLGDSTLTQLDIRYARMVRHIQHSLKNGIHDLIIWKCLVDGITVPQFDVNMTHILTAEDDRRSKIVADSIQKVRDLLDIIEKVDPEIYSKIDRSSLIYFILSQVGIDEDLFKIFVPEENTEDEQQEENNVDEFGAEENSSEEEMDDGLDGSGEELPDIPTI